MPSFKKTQVDGTTIDPPTTTLNLAHGSDVTLSTSKSGDVTTVTIDASGTGAYANASVYPVVLSSAASGQACLTFKPGVAGKVRKISAHVVYPATTTSKVASFVVAISGVSISGGIVTVTSTAAATAGTVIEGSAVGGLNSFTASQTLTVVPTGVTAFAEGQIALAIFLQAP